jgi:hypothetical protein
MGHFLSKNAKKALESKVKSKVLEVVDVHLGVNDKQSGCEKACECTCECKSVLKDTVVVLKQARESIEKSDALLSDFKAFILQMRHVESL